MSSQKWIKLLLVMVAVFFVALAGVNYFVDPFGYFRAMRGTLTEYQEDKFTYLRDIKAEYIKKYGKEYDAFLIGGSKAGAFDTQRLSELDGYKYYNDWIVYGNFREYKNNVRYIIENTNVKKFILHISGSEVEKYNRDKEGDVYKIPALVSGASREKEMANFLVKSVDVSTDLVVTRLSEGGVKYPMKQSGERNLTKYYSKIKKGSQAYVEEFVTFKYEEHLQRLFYDQPKNKAFADNIRALKEIKAMCEENNIELMVIIGSAAMTELWNYESEAYWDYLANITDIVPVWDFSTICPINRNPYNFYDDNHYKAEVADEIVNVILGKSNPEGFGTYVTKENREEFIKRRKELYFQIKDEYDQTGTVALLDKSDVSYLKNTR